ncbi:MAG: hypothetical protein IJA69_01055 [Clostridia bacterium]|nr:hypothetical protein [Clostridia bacterium]
MRSKEHIDWLKSIQKTKKESAKRELAKCEKNIENITTLSALSKIKLKSAKQYAKLPFAMAAALGLASIGFGIIVLPVGIVSLAGCVAFLGVGVKEKKELKALMQIGEECQKVEKLLQDYSQYLTSEIGLYEFLEKEIEKFKESENPETNMSYEDIANATVVEFEVKQEQHKNVEKSLKAVEKLSKQAGISIDDEYKM